MYSTNDQSKSRLDLIRQKLYIIIYGVNTPAGKAFDIGLLIVILLSVFTIMAETVEGIDHRFHDELIVLEWIFTIVFTIEYLTRIFVSKKPFRYIFSFYGIIDLLSILPMFFSLFLVGSHILSSFRILRLLRLFRVFRLIEFMEESSRLKVALLASRAKIMVFLYTVMIISILIGTLMYYIEGPENGFTSIPKSVFYTIVTLTTVGYGDMVPTTALGQFFSMVLMVIGYGIIAVPTGIVGVEIAREAGKKLNKGNENNIQHTNLNGIVCAHCNKEGHRTDADYCYSCGHFLNS
ncbi:voltage-gated potassium channel [Paenimyroides ummariense]|uniref:Voltage-gated potassium channel n=1 Tax=Paenimyroides ummariense TaxID=913024 RepID=A0A1I5FQW3_9FLAO|nr:ion transporter [Paenimyroides ummariense]SFO25591.1 voltage-gated potassium channel [Paenimyroides ummariense]